MERYNHSQAVSTRDSEIDEMIVDLVKRREHVSFVEVQQAMRAAGLPADGPYAACLGNREHIILWAEISAELLAAFKRLVASGRIYLHPAMPLLYVLDGVLPRLPLAHTLNVETDSWLPAVLCSYPHPARQAVLG